MKKNLNHQITVKNKKYQYSILPKDKKTTLIICNGANINQEFLNEDVPSLLHELPNLILAEKEYQKKQTEVIRFRVTPEDKKKIEQKALKKGYGTISSFLRDLALGT